MLVKFRFRNKPWEVCEGLLEETGIQISDYRIWYLDENDNLVEARNVLDWKHPKGRFKPYQLNLGG